MAQQKIHFKNQGKNNSYIAPHTSYLLSFVTLMRNDERDKPVLNLPLGCLGCCLMAPTFAYFTQPHQQKNCQWRIHSFLGPKTKLSRHCC